MNHKIKGFTRTLAVIAGATLLIAACGGGSSSSGRQRNAALDCYTDQVEMEAVIAEAEAALVKAKADAETVQVDEGASGGGYRRPSTL